ncbi:MAG: hypothetical protein WBD20_08565 [Pirellulaceae bacterium]
MKFASTTLTIGITAFYFIASAEAQEDGGMPSMKQSARMVTQILDPSGQPVEGGTVFREKNGSIHVFGDPDSVRLIQSGDDRVSKSPDGMMMEMDDQTDIKRPHLVGAMGMKFPEFYYVVHPEHGFAFLPSDNAPIRTFGLRPSANMKISVPKKYSPKDFVVLACWQNRYADPISNARLHSQSGSGLGLPNPTNPGGAEFGAPSTSNPAPWDPDTIYDPWRTQFSDWRLRTMVTHWNVLEIEATKDDAYANVAHLVMPPGEVRITLIPKAAINPSDLSSPPALERLLFFGGPTKIKLIESAARGTQNNLAILPSEAVRDIEFIGSPTDSMMPDWTDKTFQVFLTQFVQPLDTLVPTNSERKVRKIAESERSARSKVFLGRIAHRIGKQRYLAIGVPAGGQYFVWSADNSELAGLARSTKLCDYPSLGQSLPAMSVRMLGRKDADSVNPVKAEILAHRKEDNDILRPVYGLHVATSKRTLIDLTKPPVFEKVDPKLDPNQNPDVDPFTVKKFPHQDVGIIAENDLGVSPDRPTKSKTPAVAKNANAKHPVMIAENKHANTNAQKRVTVDELRKRIEKLDNDLSRAKQLLNQITAQTAAKP